MTQPPHVAASKRRQRRSCRRSRSQLRRRHHRIALIDCVYATQLLHSLCFGGFGFSFSFSLFVSFSFCFRFLGRAILRCHMPHAACHTPHSTLHTRLRLLRQLEHKINVVCASVKSTGSCCGSGPKRKTWATNLKLILTPFVIAINCATFGRIDPGRLLTVECIKPYAIADAFRPAAHSTLHTWA